MSEKAALRAGIRAALVALSEEERQESDRALLARFLALPEVEKAARMFLYRGMGKEPNTAALVPALLERGKTVALPRCLPRRGLEGRVVSLDTKLVRHPYGMWEPGADCPVLPKEEIDLILTPGLAFDGRGDRLGQGGGYYDRYLAGFEGVTVALCRGKFLLPRVPALAHDRKVDIVLTESETIYVK